MSRLIGRRLIGAVCAAICLSSPPSAQDTVTLEELTAKAEAGEAAAQTALAFQYHEGRGVAQNFATAAEWARRAAEAGDPMAQNLLGKYHHGGLGVEKSQEEAVRWLLAAAQTAQSAQFVHDLGQALENGADGSSDAASAAQVYAQAAQAGHMDSAVSLGLLYQEGKGVEQDYARALELYQSAADQGHARAQNNLGLLYVRGHGVAQDYAKAASLFQASAEQGLPLAMRNLGVMYENGFGVELNEELARQLYRQAGEAMGGAPAPAQAAQPGQASAEEPMQPALAYDGRLQPLPDLPGETPEEKAQALQELRTILTQLASGGDPVAMFQLGWHLLTAPDTNAVLNFQAAQLFRAAAETGYGPAMRNLGILYFTGQGVPQDYVLGRMWLTLAGAAGQQDAQSLIDALAGTMTPAQINDAQARAETMAQSMR